MGRNQCLIGSHHMLSREQAALYKLVGRFYSAHGLHNDPDLRVIYDLFHIMDHKLLHRTSRKLPEIQDIFYFDRLSSLFLYAFAVLVKNLIHARTDGSVSHNCRFHPSISPLLKFLRSVRPLSARSPQPYRQHFLYLRELPR